MEGKIMEEKKENKWLSRKLVAFLLWTGIVVYAIIRGDVNKSLVEILQMYSTVTFVFIGIQGVVDGVKEYRK
jgi:hypothetical protein